ncbi:MAG: hypothetical protein D6B26_03750, partial [Spirochaetaceae bacterium]
PEIVAFTSQTPDIKAFICITASHNPIGWNGIKLGDANGVFGGETAKCLANRLHEYCLQPDILQKRLEEYQSVNNEQVFTLINEAPVWKEAALFAYQRWTDTVAFEGNQNLKLQLKTSLQKKPLGVVMDMNGSARASTIDVEYLRQTGCKVHCINERPRDFAHAIVPEGDSLLPCWQELKKLRLSSPEFEIGCVPDNDGDRGNLVIAGRTISAQEVFALSLISELCWLKWKEDMSQRHDQSGNKKIAVVVNDASSLRIDSICDLFNAEIFRAEVGEANLVQLAQELRSNGYVVRILGEGSNGGTILHPARIRDPINTIVSLCKFIRLPAEENQASPWQIWLNLCGLPLDTPASLEQALETLPVFQTTGAYEERAVRKNTCPNHAALKSAYEKLFEQFWQTRKMELKSRFNVHSFKWINTEGTVVRHGIGPQNRSGDESGGMTIQLLNDMGKPIGFFWMRGSKTEPVFRLMVDIKSDNPEDERILFDYHRNLLDQADTIAKTERLAASDKQE